jgi:hypothetical protein
MKTWNETTTLAPGVRVKVIAGSHRGKVGVIELTRDYPVGRRYRVMPEERRGVEDIFWATADELSIHERNIAAGPHDERTQRGLDLLMGRNRT